jgi:hypothetical protein
MPETTSAATAVVIIAVVIVIPVFVINIVFPLFFHSLCPHPHPPPSSISINLSSLQLAYSLCPSRAVVYDWVSGNVNCRNCSCGWDLSKLSFELSAGLPLMCLNLMQVNFLMWNHVERRTLLTIPCGGGHRSWDWMLEGHTFRFIYLKDKMVHIYTCVMDELIKPVLQVDYSACYSVQS